MQDILIIQLRLLRLGMALRKRRNRCKYLDLQHTLLGPQKLPLLDILLHMLHSLRTHH